MCILSDPDPDRDPDPGPDPNRYDLILSDPIGLSARRSIRSDPIYLFILSYPMVFYWILADRDPNSGPDPNPVPDPVPDPMRCDPI
jgi:hypothetical protein